MKKTFTLFILGATALLTGCQSVLDAPTEIQQPQVAVSHQDPAWQQHLVALAKIKAYTSKGQFGYIEGKSRFSSHFQWQYNTPTQFGLTLSSNLSSQTLSLQRNPQGLTVKDNKGKSRTEKDIDGLMREIIGVSFPIDQFAYWLKGLPEQGSQYIINEKRQLAQFTYQVKGQLWKVTYVEYHEDRQPNLPKLIVLASGQQTLKIRIDEWQY